MTASSYALQKAEGYPRTRAFEYLYSPQPLLTFHHLLLLAPHLILILYHHHRVLLKYTGSLGVGDFPLCYNFHWIVARIFCLVFCPHACFLSSVCVIRCTCRFTHKQHLFFVFRSQMRTLVRRWARRSLAHDTRAQYMTSSIVWTTSVICVRLMIPYRPDVLRIPNAMIS